MARPQRPSATECTILVSTLVFRTWTQSPKSDGSRLTDETTIIANNTNTSSYPKTEILAFKQACVGFPPYLSLNLHHTFNLHHTLFPLYQTSFRGRPRLLGHVLSPKPTVGRYGHSLQFVIKSEAQWLYCNIWRKEEYSDFSYLALLGV